MDKNQINQRMVKLTKRTYWLGVGLGFLLGLITGCLVGYALSSDATLVIPLGERIKA